MFSGVALGSDVIPRCATEYAALYQA